MKPPVATDRTVTPRCLIAARWLRVTVLLGVIILALSIVTPIACQLKPSAPKPAPVERVKSKPPIVRVKLARAARTIVLGVDGPFRIEDSHRVVILQSPKLSPIEAGLNSGQLTLGDHRFAINRYIDIIPQDSGSLSVDHRHYRGSLRIHCVGDGMVLPVNHVGIEEYLKGVLPAELPHTFRVETFRAQAIAARTFALYETCSRRGHGRMYDLGATQASQVYKGRDIESDRAVEAVERTRGIVLVGRTKHRWKIFPTYFSSTCGGQTQPARHLASIDPAFVPLSGNVKCFGCTISPRYRWGARRLSAARITEQLNQRLDRRFDRIDDIQIARRSASGRIAMIKVVDRSGQSILIPGETFRLIVGPREMPSTWCEIRRDGSDFVFSEGKGLGHGVGMCQWGAEGMARQRWTAAEILRYYYPDSRLVRAY